MESNNNYNEDQINEIIESINGLSHDENYHSNNQVDNNNIDIENNWNDKVEDDNSLEGQNRN